MRVIGKTEEVGKHTATISGTLPDGKGVMLNRDGQLVKVENTSLRESPQGAIPFNATEVDKEIRSCVANGHVVIMYRDNENSNNYYGKLIVGSINAESGLITFGNEFIFYQAVTAGHFGMAYDSNSDRVLITYTHSTASGQHAYMRVAEINYTNKNITLGTEVQLTSTTTFYTDAVFDSNVNKFLVLYRTSSSYAVAATIDPSNNSVSKGTVLTWDGSGHNYIRGTFDSNRNMILVTYSDQGDSSYGKVRPFQINVGSPDTVSNPTNAITYQSSATDNNNIMFDPSTNCHLIVFNHTNGYGYATVCRLQANGTPEFPENLSSAIRRWIFRSFSGSGSQNSIALNTATNTFMVAHKKQSNSNGMRTQISISAKDSLSINSVDLVQYSANDLLPFSSFSNYENVVYEPTTDYVVFNYADTTNGKSLPHKMGQQKILCEDIPFPAPMGNVQSFSMRLCWAGSNKIMVAKYNNTDNKIYVKVGTVADTGITYGSEVDVLNGQNPTTAGNMLDMIYDSGNDKVVIFYSGSSNYITAIIGTISGTSSTWTGNVIVSSNTVSEFGTAYYDSTNKKIGYFYKHPSTNYLHAKHGTIDPTTLDGGNTSWIGNNFGDQYTVDNTTTNGNYLSVCYNKTEDTILYNWVEFHPSSSPDRRPKLRIGRSYSTGSSASTVNAIRLHHEVQNHRIEWESGQTRDTRCMHVPSKNIVIMGYRDADQSNYFNYHTGQMQGLGWNDESVGSTGTIFSGSVGLSQMEMVWDESFDKGLFIYGNGSGVTQIRPFTLTTTGTITMGGDAQIPFGDSSYAFGGTRHTIDSLQAVYIPTIERTVILARFDSFDNDTTKDEIHSYVFRADGSNLQNLNSTFIGISSDDKVDIKGSINTSAKSQYGNAFTVGNRYYITTEGELVDSQATTSVFAGTALSSTELLVKG